MDVTKIEIKYDFLISTNAFADQNGSLVEVVVEPSDVHKEANEATCEVSENEEIENDENSGSPRKIKPRRLKPPSTPKTLFDLETLPNVVQDLVENVGWTKPAVLRLIHVVNQTYDVIGNEFINLYLAIIQSQMTFVCSFEKVASECYIRPEDIQRFRKRNTAENNAIEYFKTNFDVDLSIPKIKEILFKLYDFSHFLYFNRETKLGNHKINPSEKAEISGSRKSVRSRKSLTSPTS